MNKESNLLKLEDTVVLSRIARQASKQANDVAKVLKLSVKYVKGRKIVERDAMGNITEIKTLKKVAIPTSFKKGHKLCLK